MGYDYYAASIVGCRVPASKIARTFKTECGCDTVTHRNTPNCCPNCGALYNLVEVVEVEGFDGEKFRGLDVICGMDGLDGDVYIGMFRNIDSGSRPRCYRYWDNEVEGCFDAVRNVLGPCGLFDADQFGVWCVLSGG